MNILLGLTTTPQADYRKMIEEIKKYNITEISFFPTAINQEKRKELYNLLEETTVKSIPQVHLRDDMESWELEYLEKRYAVQVFNIHSRNDVHSFLEARKFLGNFPGKIYIENTPLVVPDSEELSEFSGLCIDFSHWQDGLLLSCENYDERIKEAARKFHVGCSHVSGVGKTIIESTDVALREVVYRNYSKHFLNDLSELDYMKNFLDYLPELVCLELENTFEEQLKAKEYLEEIMAHKAV